MYTCLNLNNYNTGILTDKTMIDKLMYIPNADTHNYPFCRLQLANDTELLLIMEQSIFLLLLFHTSDKTVYKSFEL